MEKPWLKNNCNIETIHQYFIKIDELLKKGNKIDSGNLLTSLWCQYQLKMLFKI